MTPTRALLETLGVPASRAVVVGDDPVCDIVGGRDAGCATIRIRRPRRDVVPGAEADVVVAGVAEIGVVAGALVTEGGQR